MVLLLFEMTVLKSQTYKGRTLAYQIFYLDGTKRCATPTCQKLLVES